MYLFPGNIQQPLYFPFDTASRSGMTNLSQLYLYDRFYYFFISFFKYSFFAMFLLPF